tara:strand:- start:11459 stop:12088 length:630 start_codon:yes stop_codon:yes gene_type:complete
MTLADAYNHLDLLLDKANQPYFSDDEKDVFINLSITEFLNSRYSLIRANQDFSEMTGARASINQNSTANISISDNYVEIDNYHHITNARLNGVTCRILSDDEGTELLASNNPFKSIDLDNPACWVTSNPGYAPEVRIFFHPDIGSNADGSLDFAADDSFSIRYLRHLTVSDWEDIPEQYQYDILNIVNRKLTANIESTNYAVQANEAQQ